MEIVFSIKTGVYYDSITLMNIQKDISQRKNVIEASVVMATEVNKKILQQAGLWVAGLEKAKAEDLVISIKAEDGKYAQEAMSFAEQLLSQGRTNKSAGGIPGAQDYFPKSLDTALRQMPDANIAFISVPGRYARDEAKKALERNLHVMLFSDNVSIEQELELKQLAREKDLLVMGPDCGTAIISGIGLGFANAVRKGTIGVVGASGTGTQEVTSRIHNYGFGISHAIGTGGRDLSPQIGGITMIQGIQALASDPQTEVIVLISKPPAAEVAEKVIHHAIESRKSIVVNFLGDSSKNRKMTGSGNLVYATTLEEAAWFAVLLAQKKAIVPLQPAKEDKDFLRRIQEETARLSPKQKYLRALYSGGTLGYEALLALEPNLSPLYSNLSKKPEHHLEDPARSTGHCIIDLGEDEYTVGRPHPMIDNSFRAKRLIQEASDPETAVIMLDIVLGYGSQEEPLADLLPAISKGKEIASKNGGCLIVVAYICGTDTDIQNKSTIEKTLRDQNVWIPSTHGEAIALARKLLKR